MTMETPCHRCTKRKINCHANCQEYLDYRKKADKLRDESSRQRREDAGFIAAKIDFILKWRKRLRRK